MRRSERIEVDTTTRLKPNDWSSLEVRLVDLSAEGFRVQCDAAVLRGALVAIALPGLGEVEAQVSWRRRGEFGAKFIVPIDMDAAGIEPVPSERVLARLLVQRADALSGGRFVREQELRERIRSALPMVRL
ncbi:MAG TPA: PilZ domain-containing protein [Allosphingosinicella sp.]